MSRITFRLTNGREVYVGDRPADPVEIYHDGMGLEESTRPPARRPGRYVVYDQHGEPAGVVDGLPNHCPACAGRNLTNLSKPGGLPVWICDDCIPF